MPPTRREPSFEEEIVASVSNPTVADPTVATSAPTELATTDWFVDGRYRVVREIATGGMGVVVEAIHLHTGRSVALKRVLDVVELRDELIARLAREANVLGVVAHPGVVEVLDAYVSPDAPSYLVMEKLVGRTLEGLLLVRPRMPLASVATIGVAVADALAYVHERGFVHRDVKPANVFVSRDRFRGEVVKLIDFGLATSMDGEAPSAARPLTRTGETVGTPTYMAPEQLGGLPVDERADIYALAATLYESLTDVLPGGDSLDAVIERMTAGRRPRPIRELRPDVSERLAAVLDACLSPSRDARPPLAALHAALVEETTHHLATDVLGSSVDVEGPTESPIPLRRRRHPRFAFVTRLRVHLDDGTVVVGSTEELSRNGVQVRLPASPALAGTLRLEIALPTGPVHVVGEVRWTRATSQWQLVGIALGAEPTGALAAYVRELAARYRADPGR